MWPTVCGVMTYGFVHRGRDRHRLVDWGGHWDRAVHRDGHGLVDRGGDGHGAVHWHGDRLVDGGGNRHLQQWQKSPVISST